MTIRVMTQEEDFLALRREWNGLLEKSRVNRPFLQHEWVWAWWKAFGAGNSLHMLQFEEAGRPVAFAPLRVGHSSQFGLTLQTLFFAANSHSNETGLVLSQENPNVYEKFIDYLEQKGRSWDLIFLELLDETDPFLGFIRKNARLRRFCWGTKPSIGSPVVDLPRSFEEYVNGLSKKSRYNVRKKRRKIEEIPGFEIRKYFDTRNLPDFWRHVEEIEKKSWKFKVGKDLLSRPEVKKFYRLLLRAMAAKGQFRGFVLFLHGKPAAYEMTFEYGKELYSQKIAYDAAWASVSAGFVLKTEVIRWATEQGLARNHLLGDVEPWKLQLNGKLRPHLHLKIYSPSFRSHLVAKAEFEGIKKLGQIKRSLIEMKRVLL